LCWVAQGAGHFVQRLGPKRPVRGYVLSTEDIFVRGKVLKRRELPVSRVRRERFANVVERNLEGVGD
jgi:hypothetical protein